MKNNHNALLPSLLICLFGIIRPSAYKISIGYGLAMDYLFFSAALLLLLLLFFVFKRKTVPNIVAFTLSICSFVFVLSMITVLRPKQTHLESMLFVNKSIASEKTLDLRSIYIDNKKIEVSKPLTIQKINVYDPECTGCEDCVIRGNKALDTPIELNEFWHDPVGKDVLFLSGNNPYLIENEAYKSYELEGYVKGIRAGRLVFEVINWKTI
jgi:hypothetical protein